MTKSALRLLGILIVPTMLLVGCSFKKTEEPIENTVMTVETETSQPSAQPNFVNLGSKEVEEIANSYGLLLPNPYVISSQDEYDTFINGTVRIAKEEYPSVAQIISRDATTYDILIEYIDIYQTFSGDALDVDNWMHSGDIYDIAVNPNLPSPQDYRNSLKIKLGYSAEAIEMLALSYGVVLGDPNEYSDTIYSRESYLDYVDYFISTAETYYPALEGLVSEQETVNDIMKPYEDYFDSLEPSSDEKTDWRTQGRLYSYMIDSSRSLPSVREVQLEFERDLAETAREILCMFGRRSC